MLDHGEIYDPNYNTFREVFCADHAAAIYRREVFEKIGKLDESLFMYSDDVDLGFRARLCGYRCLYVPDAIVYHERGGTIGRNSPTQVRLIYRNMLTVYLKNMPWPLMRNSILQTVRLLIGMLHHAPHHGAALWGVLEALWRLPNTLRKRQQIQRTRTVTIEQLHIAMTMRRIT
jgi:GT2 family glycosyltransferase